VFLQLAPEPPWATDKKACRTLREAAALFFRCLSPKLVTFFLLIPLAARVALGGFTHWDAVLTAGIVVGWGLQEHWAHKHLLHLKPFQLFGRTFDLYFARRHRAHHRAPWDLAQTMLPPRVVITAAVINAALWWLIMPTRELALTGITAYTAMALLYEWSHYLTHTPYQPKGRLYRRILMNHRLHHFKHEDYWLGFTNPFFDDLFGTAPDPATVEKSPTVSNLGVDEDPEAYLL
jgi:hypothetical protein